MFLLLRAWHGFAGKFADQFGVKMSYSVCVLVWSLACCGHAFIRNMLGFGVMRAFLGMAEAGSFPCAVKAVSEWFPRKEQSLAVCIITSSTSIGAVLAPALVPWLEVSFDWQSAFLLTGIPGFIWFGLLSGMSCIVRRRNILASSPRKNYSLFDRIKRRFRKRMTGKPSVGFRCSNTAPPGQSWSVKA